MCFVRISEQTAIISLYSINWLVCITETECVYCAVRTVFMCFVWIPEQTAIISLYSINWLVCITETECVYCAVRTEYLCIIQVNFCCYCHKEIIMTYKILVWRIIINFKVVNDRCYARRSQYPEFPFNTVACAIEITLTRALLRECGCQQLRSGLSHTEKCRTCVSCCILNATGVMPNSGETELNL
jgi:hypothetical protein